VRHRWCQTVLKAGSCAAGTREPRQVREEAAVSGHPWVPQERLAGAGWQSSTGQSGSTGGARCALIIDQVRREAKPGMGLASLRVRLPGALLPGQRAIVNSWIGSESNRRSPSRPLRADRRRPSVTRCIPTESVPRPSCASRGTAISRRSRTT